MFNIHQIETLQNLNCYFVGLEFVCCNENLAEQIIGRVDGARQMLHSSGNFCDMFRKTFLIIHAV